MIIGTNSSKTAVVKEGLRLSSGILGILPRVVPPEGAIVKNQFIPGGVREPLLM